MINLIKNIDISCIEFLYKIQHNLKSDIINKTMIFFTNLGDNGIIWIMISLILLCTKKYRKSGIISVISLIVCSVTVNLILKPLVHRPRPFNEIAHIVLLIKAPKDFSFSSGHTAASFTAVYIFFKNMKKYFFPVLIIALFIAFSRLYLTVHYPSDVFAGILIGLFSGFAGEKIFYRFLNKNSS